MRYHVKWRFREAKIVVFKDGKLEVIARLLNSEGAGNHSFRNT